MLPDHQLPENLILTFDFYEREKRGQSEFVTKFAGISVTIIFKWKYLKYLVKSLPHSVFSLITWHTNP